MRGEKPVNLRQLQEEVSNKKSIMNGAHILYKQGKLSGGLEDVKESEAKYQEAAARLMALPQPPVLPPISGLCKITGELEVFSRQRCQADFEVDFYRTNPLPNAGDAQRLAGGAAAMAAGSPALGALLASEDKPLVSTADYIQGQIKGMPFRGWVGMTDLKAGDEVEMVAEWQTDHYEVYAIAYPAERIISVCPECEMGRYAYSWLRLKYMFILVMLLVSIPLFILPFFNGNTYLEGMLYILDLSKGNYVKMWSMIFIMDFMMCAVLAISAYKAYAPTTCKLAEDIFRTMGWACPEKINLNKTTARHERKLKRAGKWYSPKCKDKPLRPTSKWAGQFEYWYYY